MGLESTAPICEGASSWTRFFDIIARMQSALPCDRPVSVAKETLVAPLTRTIDPLLPSTGQAMQGSSEPDLTFISRSVACR